MAAKSSTLDTMSAEDICQWLISNKPIHETVLKAIRENDLDGEALSAAIEHGPDSLKEVIPSLGSRLKLIGAIKTLKCNEQEEFLTSTPTAPFDDDEFIDNELSDYQSPSNGDISTGITPSVSQSSSTDDTPSRCASIRKKSLLLADITCQKKRVLVQQDFEMPIFRPETRKNLDAERLTERDRRYIVRTVSTILLSSNPRPSMLDCAVPAKAIVKAYPFLADASEDGKEPYFSWMRFISQRCSNVNRGDIDQPKAKQARLDILLRGKHLYLDNVESLVSDDPQSLSRIIEKLSHEMSKSNPKPEILDSLMQQSYSSRRLSILNGEKRIVDLCDIYPLLRKPKHISKEFDRITGLKDSMTVFVSEWQSTWIHSILEVAKEEGFPINDSEELESFKGFKSLVNLTVPKRKKDNGLSHVFISVKAGTPHDEIVGTSNQPMIVEMHDIEDRTRNHYYIMAEQVLMQDTRHFDEALFLLLAVHYVFDLKYDDVIQDALTFLQEFVFKLKDKGRKRASYTSITSRIYRKTVKET